MYNVVHVHVITEHTCTHTYICTCVHTYNYNVQFAQYYVRMCVTTYSHTCSEGLHIDEVHLVSKEDSVVECVHTAEKQVMGIDQIITDLRILTCKHHTNVCTYVMCTPIQYVHTYVSVYTYT